MNNILGFALILLTTVIFTSCMKEDPIIPNEEELITTLIYRLTPEVGGDVVELKFVDLDGDGGNAPVISNGILQNNAMYSGELSLLNEQSTPSQSITSEVADEGEAHQVFYQSDFSGVNTSYNDMDSNGKPIGLSTILETSQTGSSNLKIILRHEPDKFAPRVADGDIENAGGETDIEVIFTVNVQ